MWADLRYSAEMSKKFLGVPDVVPAVLAITQLSEDTCGGLSTLIQTRNLFEGWWLGTLVAGFAGQPWSRDPGWDAANTDGAELSMECTVEVTDRRLTYSRRTGSGAKRIDLAVKRGGPDTSGHLIELKLLDRGWSLKDQMPKLVKDAHALEATAGWDDVVSGWLLVLAIRFENEGEVISSLKEVFPNKRIGAIELHPVRVTAPAGKVWLAGLRFA